MGLKGTRTFLYVNFYGWEDSLWALRYITDEFLLLHTEVEATNTVC